MKHCIIPVFIPHLACPYSCVFCNQKHISGTHSVPDSSSIRTIIDRHLATMDATQTFIEIGFFGGSFTCLPPDRQRYFLELTTPYLQSGKVKSIRVSTRPDYINPEILMLLKEYLVQTVELGVQSLNDSVLMLSGRGHTTEDVYSAVDLLKEYGFNVGLQMMIGLPGDQPEISLETARKIVELKPYSLRIYPTLVVKNTMLETMYLNGGYRPLSMDEAIDISAEIMKLCIENNLNVIRLGLHPSEELLNSDALVAGPFHPSFRELVMSRIWYGIFSKTPFQINHCVKIAVAEDMYNYAIGYEAINKKFFKLYFEKIVFVRDPHLKKLEYHVDYC